jgi:RHS repeat-associated protein
LDRSLKSGGYAKHYYIEGQRIVSKLGGGWDNNGKGPLKAGNGKVDYAAKAQRVFDGIVKNLKFLGANGQILTAGKSGKVPPGQINGTGGNVTESFRYFFHRDHLGSTSYVTDASGEVYQHLEYFAYGETFVDEHSNTDRTPYLFNAKELDEETNLYYYGARYYDPKTSIWQSVDQNADKYVSTSPYAYVFNNPLTFVDPNGKDGIISIKGNTITVKVDIYLWGKDATKAAATQIKQVIMNNWEKQSSGAGWTYTDASTGKVYDVKFDVSVNLYENKPKNDPFMIPESWNPSNTDNFIKVDNTETREFVDGGDEGTWTTNDTWTSAHEFGHLIDLDDKYKDTKSGSQADPGWAGNMMADYNGTVQQKNIDDVVSGTVKKFNKASAEEQKDFKVVIDP